MVALLSRTVAGGLPPTADPRDLRPAAPCQSDRMGVGGAGVSTRPVLLGTAFLAYGFGLRHAVDADHIAAIDNATRKLMQEGKRPVGVGLFFALGHSTVVVLAAAAWPAWRRRSQGPSTGSRRSAASSAPASLLVLVRHRDRQPDHSARRVADLPARPQGRPLRRGGFRSPAQQPRPARALVPPAVPNRSARAGTCTRSASCSGSVSTPRPR